MRLPGRRPATEEISTDDAPSSITGRAAFRVRKCERRFTAKTRSQSSAEVPSNPIPIPMPTLSTSASSPPRTSAAHSTASAHASGSAASAQSA